MKITWIGHSALLLEGSCRMMIDPFLSGNPASGLTVDEIMSCDVVAVTHDHGDHMVEIFDLISGAM